jgi:UPF0176 protein
MTYLVSSFYKFVRLTDLEQKKEDWLAYCQQKGVRGTILLASEGINATIAGLPDAISEVLALLKTETELSDLTTRDAWSENWPFERMKVKIKPEIVTLGRPDINPNDQVGIYVSPQEWNALLQDPEVIVIDTRNGYEVEIGTFQGATNPMTREFREFPNYVAENLDPKNYPKVAMFCTGGIRCEKASAFMVRQGFEKVYHLKGGILNYLATISPQKSLWQGECFVFDERIALKHGLSEVGDEGRF